MDMHMNAITKIRLETNEMKEIELSGCNIIGKGQCSQVYLIANGNVVKLFESSISKEQIQKEYDINCMAYKKGLASVQCFGFVTCNGRVGIEMERVKGVSLEQAILDSDMPLDGFAVDFAQNLLQMHSNSGDLSLMPSAEEFYLGCVHKCMNDKWITESEGLKLAQLIRQIPRRDTMLHGDYHVLNMMIENGRMKMIDLADCMSGNAIYDLLVANIYLHYLPLNLEPLYQTLIKVPAKDSLYMWDIFLETYFETKDAERISCIKKMLDGYSMLKIMLSPYSFSNLPRESLAGFVEMGRKELMPKIDEYIGIIPDNIKELCRF